MDTEIIQIKVTLTTVLTLIAAVVGFFLIIRIAKWIRGGEVKMTLDQKIKSRESGWRLHNGKGPGQGSSRGSRGLWRNNSTGWNKRHSN